MLINEQRLRELYARDEIDLEHLERSLEIINQRKLAAERRPTGPSPASTPLSPREKSAMLSAAIQASGAAKEAQKTPPMQTCPQCGCSLRSVVEYGIRTNWCATCQAYIGRDPREALKQQRAQEGSGTVWIVGGIFPLS